MKTKSLDLAKCEIKAQDDGTMRFAGYASVFGGVDSYGDTIDPKAYDETLKNRKRPVRMRWNHYGPVIGKWLKMQVDERGLYVEGELTPGHSVASDVYASLKHEAVTGMSIGYFVKEAEGRENGTTLLKQIELVEISVVEEPADNAAQVGDVKSQLDDCKSLKEIEAILRDVGRFSQTEAKSLIAKVKAVFRRDAEKEKQVSDDLENLFEKYANITRGIK